MLVYPKDSYNNKSMIWPSIVYKLVPTSIKKPPSHLRKYANLNGRSNTIYNTKYKIVVLEGLRDTLYRCTEVNNDLNTQLLSLMYWPQISHAMYWNISQMVDKCWLASHRIITCILKLFSWTNDYWTKIQKQWLIVFELNFESSWKLIKYYFE